MKLKRFVIMFLCFAVAMSLVACDTEKDSGTQPSTASTGPSETPGSSASVSIVTDAESYTVEVDGMTPISAVLEGAEGELTYVSQDESTATVNKYGKIIGIKPGTTEIVITAPDGTAKTVSVTVEGMAYSNVLRLALNVLYNDLELGCYNTEYGPYVEIYEDGQYTVTFDATMHLSESSRMMGINSLKNLTAIFLYDHAVRTGDQMVSAVTSCDIRWDSVSVNGQSLTVNNSDFKSAIKSTGIVDTNDPFNAWDGSAVDEVIVDTDNHVLNIDVENPVSVSITFTIQNLIFAEE